MRLSEERISHISHIIMDGIWRDDLVDYVDEDKVLKIIKRTIADYLKVEDDADETARRKIRSIKRHIPEGSKEWDILYNKYYEEEIEKKRL